MLYTTSVKSKGMFVKTRMSLRTTRRMHKNQNQSQDPMTTLGTLLGHREWGRHLHAISVKCLTRVRGHWWSQHANTLMHHGSCLQVSKYFPALFSPLQIDTWEEKRKYFFFFNFHIIKVQLKCMNSVICCSSVSVKNTFSINKMWCTCKCTFM